MPEFKHPEVEEAVNVVARSLLASEIALNLEWEDVPEICEYDFERVYRAANRILSSLEPPPETVAAAMALLVSRVDPNAC